MLIAYLSWLRAVGLENDLLPTHYNPRTIRNSGFVNTYINQGNETTHQK